MPEYRLDEMENYLRTMLVFLVGILGALRRRFEQDWRHAKEI